MGNKTKRDVIKKRINDNNNNNKVKKRRMNIENKGNKALLFPAGNLPYEIQYMIWEKMDKDDLAKFYDERGNWPNDDIKNLYRKKAFEVGLKALEDNVWIRENR